MQSELSARRRQIVEEIFGLLDCDKVGTLSASQLVAAFNAKGLPEVQDGQQDETSAVHDLLSLLGVDNSTDSTC